MDFQGFPKIPRYSRECVITEKIDGTNGQIYIQEDPDGCFENTENLITTYDTLGFSAGSRSRWLSLKKDNFGFAQWVVDNVKELRKFGPGRHFGEWWGQGIQRGYGLKEKRFSLFNIKKWGDPQVRPLCCSVVPELSRGEFTTKLVYLTMEALKELGSQAAPGFMNPEGIVIFHIAGNLMFKKTFKNDKKGKGEEWSGQELQ